MNRTKPVSKRRAQLEQYSSDCEWWRVAASQNRHPVGTPAKYDSPEELWQACCEYFEWVENNPVYEPRHVQHRDQTWVDYVPKKRPMMITALCRFLGLSLNRWWEMRQGNVGDPKFAEVVRMADGAIREQKYIGAAVGFFRSDLISKDLGVKERFEFSGPEGGPIQYSNRIDVSGLTNEELKLIAKVKPDLLGEER